MKIIDKLIGIGLSVFGILMFYVDYLLIRTMFAIGDFVAKSIGGDILIAAGFTVLLCILIAAILAIIITIGLFALYFGIDLIKG